MKDDKDFNLDNFEIIDENNTTDWTDETKEIYRSSGLTFSEFNKLLKKNNWEQSNIESLNETILNEKIENKTNDKIEPIKIKSKKIKKINISDLSKILLKKYKSKYANSFEINQNVDHEVYENVKLLVQNNINVYLVGEMGVGKNHLAEKIANDLGIDFYPVQKVNQEYKLEGYNSANGHYIRTSFYSAFTEGGLFMLDEMDASNADALIIINAALANKYFDFPNGRAIAHPNFRVMGGGNTLGLGGNEKYNSRNKIDNATLDRFVVVQMDYNKQYEWSLANGNPDKLIFANIIISLRELSKDIITNELSFSTRVIQNGIKLMDSGMSLKDIYEYCLWKGVSQDIREIIFENFIEPIFSKISVIKTLIKSGAYWIFVDHYQSLFPKIKFKKFKEFLSKYAINNDEKIDMHKFFDEVLKAKDIISFFIK